MKKSTKLKSECCNADVESVCGDKYPNEGSTWHFECTKCHQPTRVGSQTLEDKSRVRVCKRCHEVID